jgi:hypothetical protein
MCQAATALLAN